MKLIEFTKVAEMLAKEHRIKIQEGNRWAANIKNRDVFYVKNDIHNLPEEHILGLTLHEIAHIHYTTDITLPAKNKELTHSCLNMLEDIAIEHIIAGDYPNAGEILESTKGEVLDKLVQILPTLKKSIYEKSILYAAARFEGRGYSFAIDPYEKLGNKIADIMIKRKKEIYERKETKDLMPLVNDIVTLILKEAGEPSQDDKQSMMDENAGKTDAEKDDKPTSQVKKALIDALKKEKGWKKGVSESENIVFINEIADQATKVGKQLRTVLKRNNAMEYGGRYRTGKLMAKRFVRIIAQKDRYPFARRIVKSNQSYAFAVAADVSGSMYEKDGDRETAISYALTSMYMVGEALRYAAVPRALIVFGQNAISLAPIGKTNMRWEQIASEDALQKAENEGTSINLAIIKCTEELNKTRAERKIMIVLTDGSSNQYDMEIAHKKAVKNGIECLGITIGHNPYVMDKTFSKEKNTKIRDTSDTALIGKAFIDILQASIKKSV